MEEQSTASRQGPEFFEQPFGEFLKTHAIERRDGLSFEELWPHEAIKNVQTHFEGKDRPYNHLCAFVPPSWTRKEIISREDYCKIVGKMDNPEAFGFAKKVAKGVKLVAAGGAVHTSLFRSLRSRPLEKSPLWPDDVDYFPITTHQTEDPQEIAEMQAATLRGFIQRAMDISSHKRVRMRIHQMQYSSDMIDVDDDDLPKAHLYMIVSSGCVSMVFGEHGANSDHAQLITRGPYKTIGSAISGFDLGASSLALRECETRGPEVFGTTRAAYAAAFGLELIPDLQVRSTSFAHRLKKYYMRGVGLVLPGIDPKMVENKLKEYPQGFTIDLLDFGIKILPAKNQDYPEANMWRSQLVFLGDTDCSDYAPMRGGDYHRFALMSHFANTFTSFAPKCPYRIHGSYHLGHSGKFDEEIKMTYERMLGRSENNPFRGQYCVISENDGRVAYTRRMPVRQLKCILGFSGEEVQWMIEQVASRPRKSLYFPEWATRVKIIKEIWDRYKDASFSPWITKDPQRQWTASRNPEIVEAQEWYLEWFSKDFHDSAPAALPAQQKKSVGYEEVVREVASNYVEKLMEEMTTKVLSIYATPECGICNEPIEMLGVGKANSVTLPCGHMFCMAARRDGECMGFARWIRERGENVDCPLCRSTLREAIASTPDDISSHLAVVDMDDENFPIPGAARFDVRDEIEAADRVAEQSNAPSIIDLEETDEGSSDEPDLLGQRGTIRPEVPGPAAGVTVFDQMLARCDNGSGALEWIREATIRARIETSSLQRLNGHWSHILIAQRGEDPCPLGIVVPNGVSLFASGEDLGPGSPEVDEQGVLMGDYVMIIDRITHRADESVMEIIAHYPLPGMPSLAAFAGPLPGVEERAPIPQIAAGPEHPVPTTVSLPAGRPMTDRELAEWETLFRMMPVGARINLLTDFRRTGTITQDQYARSLAEAAHSRDPF